MPRPRSLLAALLLLITASSALAAGRELAPRELGESPYRESFPAIASAGGQFLTVRREERFDFGVHIVGSLSDANGRRISPASFMVVENANPTWMQLVPTGDGYTLFWLHSPETTHMVDLDLFGRVLASRRLAVPYHVYRDIAWNGTHFLMAFRHSAGITNQAEAILFTRGGQIVRNGIAIDDVLFAVDALAIRDTFFVVTAGFNGMYGHRIGADGTVSQALLEPRRFGTSYQPTQPVAIDRGDGSLLLTWSAGDTTRSELLTAVLSAGGELTERKLIAARDASRRQLHPIHLMGSGERFVLTLLERQVGPVPDIFLTSMVLDANGEIVQEAGEPISLGVWSPAAASNGIVTAIPYTPTSPISFFRQSLQQRTIDGAGRISAPELHSIFLSRHRQPLLGAGGGRFVAAFEEQSHQSRVRLASLDAAGEPESNHFLGGQNELPDGDLVWNGTEYLLAYHDSGNIRAVRLDAHGRSVDPAPMILGGASPIGLDIATTWTGDKWIVAWTNGNYAGLASVSIGGVATQHGELKLAAPLPKGWVRTYGDIAIAAAGGRLLVAWVETQVETCLMPICSTLKTSAWLMRFQHSGAPSTRAIEIAPDAYRVNMTGSGDEYVLLAESPAETKATIIDDDYGMTFLGTKVLPAGLNDILWDGDEYVIARRYGSEWPSHLVITRFDRTLEQTAPARGVITGRSDERAAPSLASLASGDALVAISEGNATEGAKAVVYAERDMEVLPDWPPARRRAVR